MTHLARVGLLLAVGVLVLAWCEFLYRVGLMGAMR